MKPILFLICRRILLIANFIITLFFYLLLISLTQSNTIMLDIGLYSRTNV
jgi:hypothetical protein